MTRARCRREPPQAAPRLFVTFVRDHVEVTPAQVLCVPEGDSERIIAELPRREDFYAAGRVLSFGTVNAARAFVKAIGGAAVVGKVQP